MKSRKGFLHRAAAVGISVAFSASAKPASACDAASADAAPSATPVSKSATKAPSEAARAQAAGMRRFDPKLSDADLDTIARGIDAAAAGSALGGGKHPLRNGEEPVTTFAVKS